MTITYLHNPRCSKSRQALQLLQEHGASVEVREYLTNPLDAEELGKLFSALGKPPVEMIRFKESVARELGLSQADEREDAEWITLIAKNPVLLERPVAWVGDRAVVGRPPEGVLELI